MQRPSMSESARSERARAMLGRLRGPFGRVVMLSWVPLTASFLSLVLSVAGIYIANRQPDVQLLLPDVVRLIGGRQTGHSYVYLQPVFVSTGNNDRVEVVSDMTLTVEPETAPGVPFRWTEQIRLVGGADGTLSYEHEADAVALLISPRTAAAPLSTFEAPDGWFFTAGTHRFTLEATRVVSSEPMRATFTVMLRPEDLAILDDPTQERFLPPIQ